MQIRAHLSALAEGVSLLLLVVALLGMQALIGGTRMVFSLPAYSVLGVAGFFSLGFLRASKPAPDRICVMVTAGTFAYLILRALFSPVPYIARGDLACALAALIVYLLVALVFTDGRQRMFLLTCLFAFALAQVWVGAIQFRDGTNFMPFSWLRRYDYGSRASGFYVCPNHLAGLLEALGVFGLSMVCWSRWPIWAKLLLGYVSACCYVGVIITASRGGYISAAFSVAVFSLFSLIVLWRMGRMTFWKIGGPGLFAAAFLAIFALVAVSRSPLLSDRAHNLIDTDNIRLQLAQAALQQWQLQPLLGTGSATYLYFGRFFRAATMQRDPVFVHDDYLQLLAEYGVAGAAGMALLIGVHLRRGLKTFLKVGPRRVALSQKMLSNGLALNIGALAALSAYLVHSALDFNLHIPANAMLMAAVFGILANDGVARIREPALNSGDAVWGRLLVPALSLILLAFSVRHFPGEYFSEKARSAVRDNQPAFAIHSAQRGLSFDPSNPDLHHHLAEAQIQLGDLMSDPAAASSFYNAAIANFEKAHTLVPQDEVYALQLAGALDSAHRFAEAESIFEHALQLDPRSESMRQYYDGHLQLWQKPTPAPEAEAKDRS